MLRYSDVLKTKIKESDELNKRIVTLDSVDGITLTLATVANNYRRHYTYCGQQWRDP